MRLFTLLLLPAAVWAGQPRYARVGEIQGSVEVQLRASEPWISAERNLPLLESTWVRSGPASHAEIELDEGGAWRLGPDSQGEIADYSRLATGQRVTLLTLDRGIAYFTGQAEGRDSLILLVPGAEVTVGRGARIRLEAGEHTSRIAILGGVARFSSPAAEMDVREGQTVGVEPAHPARFSFNREVAPLELDRWSEGRDRTLASSTSGAHAAERFGVMDLDAAGAWVQTEDLGAVWKPKVPQGWAPYQKGRWLWYDGLGYTWVSAEEWGWLPYHYGRWLRKSNLGWIWAPSANAIFKPGDVYWLRGAGVAGWGPLAPGEAWAPEVPNAPLPQQFLEANTTYGVFQANAPAIDPTGFAERPKEPLKTMTFATALPSPVFLAAKLEAQRPLVGGGRERVSPFVEGSTFEIAPVAAPPPAPTIIVTQAPAPPPPEPQAVPYPVPVAVPSIVLVTPQAAATETPRPKVSAKEPQPVRAAVQPASRHLLTELAAVGSMPPSRGNPRRSHEDLAEEEVTRELAGKNYSKALEYLGAWSRDYPNSGGKAERAYYYLQAYHFLNQPAKVVDTSRQLLGTVVAKLRDPMQALSVLYLTTIDFRKLSTPTREEFLFGRTAAQEMLNLLPSCFAPTNRPETTSEMDWSKARSDLEALATSTLSLTGKRSFR